MIYPKPSTMTVGVGDFLVDEDTVVLLPEEATEGDVFLARFLVAELADRFQVAARTVASAEPPEGKRFFVVGAAGNPLVDALCARRNLKVSADTPGREGYVLDVAADGVVVAGSDERGAFYGLQSLRQLLVCEGGAVRVRGVRVRDKARKPFRGLRLYLPGMENLAFFKRFIRDFAAFFKYNTLVLETNAAMRLDRHPELNAGWYEFGRSLNYSRRSRPKGPQGQGQDSAHHDAGDFGVVEKADVAELVRYAARHHLEVIPEIPSLTHAYYLLTRHRELAEIRDAEWPDTYCPRMPACYDLYFDVLDEYLEVMHPKTVHIGHDEWRMEMDRCPNCRGRDYGELFVQDVNRIYDYLKARGIRTALWGDHLLEGVRGRGCRPTEREGHAYRRPGALRPEQVVAGMPKDMLVFNWFWNTRSDENAESYEEQLAAWGFEQVYGNMTPEIAEQSYARRSGRSTVLGGAASSWAATNAANFGRDLIYNFVGCAGRLWSETWLPAGELTGTVQALMPVIRRGLDGRTLPTEDGERVATLDISGQFNASIADAAPGADWDGVRSGAVGAGAKRFHLAGAGSADAPLVVAVGVQGEGETRLPLESPVIEINEDPSSLLFLHACARPAANYGGFSMVYNSDDCADLLGWYEVTYADGFVATVPIRYGLNILEWRWGREREAGTVCCRADPVDCATPGARPATFFAFEWVNGRFGKVIASVRLRGSQGFVGADGKPIPSNAVMLLGMSVAKKRTAAGVTDHLADA